MESTLASNTTVLQDHAAHVVQFMQTMTSSLVAFNLPVCQGEIYLAAWDC